MTEYDCDCEYEDGSVECTLCLMDFVEQYNKEEKDKLDLYGALKNYDAYYDWYLGDSENND